MDICKMKTKTEFQTKERLIKSLTLEGRTELIERVDSLGVDLRSYIQSVFFVNSTDSFWIDSDLINNKKEVISYEKEKNCLLSN